LSNLPQPDHEPRGRFGYVFPNGDFLMAINDNTETWVARVLPDMSFAWTWTPPPELFSGPREIAMGVVGEEVRVLLIDRASRSHLYLQGIDANGGEVWPSPLQLRSVESGHLVETRIAVARDNTLFVYAATDRGPGQLSHHLADGGQTMLTDLGYGDTGWNLIEDGALGVWLSAFGTIQHYDRTGWPLYRTWSYGERCRQRPGIVARTGPDAEPMTYFYEGGWP